MSFSKIKYDTCVYAQSLNQNVSFASYVLDPMKYVNCNGCRHELGFAPANDVSKVSGNLVDLESNLFGIDRELSRCDSMMYMPGEMKGKGMYKTTCYKQIDVTPKHCQFFETPSIVAPNALNISTCPDTVAIVKK